MTLLVSLSVLAAGPFAQAPRIKVLADQDSAGPHGTNLLSLLMLLKAPQVDLLGITTVSGDQWVEQATIFALWAVEEAGRDDVPVVKGAERPLLHTARQQELLEALYSSHTGWHGVFNPDAPPPGETWEPPGGYPRLQVTPGRAAEFIIQTIRAHPNEVVLYCGGPLTNVALAVRMDPGIVPLTKALYIMGASNAGGPELNWWWDPEAAAIVMREPWTEIVVTPGEAGAQVTSSPALMQRIVEAGGPLADHVRTLYLEQPPLAGTTTWSYMWDEISVASILDAAVIRRSETMYLDVVVDRGAKYGHTIVWRPLAGVPTFFLPYSGPRPVDTGRWQGHLQPPAELRPATVHVEVDVQRFEDLFVELMSH